MFFCGGKMFLKKRQNLLTIGNILLKSIYRDKNTFVYDRKTNINDCFHNRLFWHVKKPP